MQLQTSNSTSQARNILIAFETEDRSTLSRELRHVQVTGPEHASTFESERMDLLSGIARELQLAEDPFGASAQVYRELLKHLANVRPVSIAAPRRIKSSRAAA
jgi:hypothetical protein